MIGLDRYRPPLFGRVHPRFETPWLALASLAAATAVFVVLSGLYALALWRRPKVLSRESRF